MTEVIFGFWSILIITFMGKVISLIADKVSKKPIAIIAAAVMAAFVVMLFLALGGR